MVIGFIPKLKHLHKMNARFFPETGHGINHEISEEINAIFPAFLLSQA